MNLKPMKIITAIFALTVFFITNHAHSSGMTLCVGVDGHVDLEFAYDGECTADIENDASTNSDTTTLHKQQKDQGHCGPCVDIPIGLGHADRCHPAIQTEKNQPKITSVQIVLATVNTNVWQHSIYRTPTDPDIFPATITCLRTVSLVI